MNRFKLAFVGLLVLGSVSAHAEALDGYVGLSGGLVKHMSTTDQIDGEDSRYSFRIDFVRLQRNVALDLRFGNGMSYQDWGGALKVFHHFAFSNATATGLSVGGGLGAMYSRAGLESTQNTFYEIFAPVFARVIFDMGLGFGLFLDAEYNAMFQRRFPGGEQADNSDIQNRYFFGAGIAIVAM